MKRSLFLCAVILLSHLTLQSKFLAAQECSHNVGPNSFSLSADLGIDACGSIDQIEDLVNSARTEKDVMLLVALASSLHHIEQYTKLKSVCLSSEIVLFDAIQILKMKGDNAFPEEQAFLESCVLDIRDQDFLDRLTLTVDSVFSTPVVGISKDEFGEQSVSGFAENPRPARINIENHSSERLAIYVDGEFICNLAPKESDQILVISGSTQLFARCEIGDHKFFRKVFVSELEDYLWKLN